MIASGSTLKLLCVIEFVIVADVADFRGLPTLRRRDDDLIIAVGAGTGGTSATPEHLKKCLNKRFFLINTRLHF